MVTPLGKLTDLPTFKEKVRQQPNNVNYGLVGYPVLMTADIVLYKADLVPVGIDQAPHLEFARETVRSFNYRYNTNVLIEPQMKVTEVPKVLGIDGVAEDEQEPEQPHRAGRHPRRDPQAGDDDGHRPAAHAPQRPGQPGRVQRVHHAQDLLHGRRSRDGQRNAASAGIGCVDCKKLLAANLNAHLAPFRDPPGRARPKTRTSLGCAARRRQPRPRHRRRDHGWKCAPPSGCPRNGHASCRPAGHARHVWQWKGVPSPRSAAGW